VQTVFQHSTQACVVPGDIYADIPDTPAHAFRNAAGQVILSDSNAYNFQNVGTTLDNVVHSCAPSMKSAMNPDYNADTYQEWLHSGGYPHGRHADLARLPVCWRVSQITRPIAQSVIVRKNPINIPPLIENPHYLDRTFRHAIEDDIAMRDQAITIING
jgi:hypothetical protein